MLLLTLPFARLTFSEVIAAQQAKLSRPTTPEAHRALIERAKFTFAWASTTNTEIKDGLTELRHQLRMLAQRTSAL